MSIINLSVILVLNIIYWIFFGRDPKVIGICIWRALGLSIPTFMGAIIGIIEIYHFLFLYLKFSFSQVSESYVALLPVLLFLILSLVIYLIFVGLYLLLLKIFWRNPPKWLRFRNWRTIFLGFMISVLAALPATITYVPFFVLIPSSELIIDTLMKKGYEASDIIGGMFLIWFLFAVELYHSEYKFKKWCTYRKTTKSQ
ncbi:hypothetical protein H6G06_09460 [Anabaena sphaerica FACHB-251]|uniref:Uncharacterized protein n=1 Tax=Anabaena sphaerica FACHB-251 TaxID=2692883 RepID=A0A926WHR4_9NOST|nr:hypothetical protein [Anabaena sphaerica]MBD2293711.1 hypothetical protein [Anabaena sphaerica FACHB-251]